MIKLIASDLDGTLLRNGSQNLKPQLFDMILELQGKGVRFVAASGRQLASMYRLFEPIKEQISYIGENGTICVLDNKIVSRVFFERELSMEIIGKVRQQKDCELLVSCENTCYVESKDRWFINQIENVIKNDVTVVDDVMAIPHPFLKVAVYSGTKIDELNQRFKQLFGNKVKVATSGNVWLDFIPPEANKGVCLERLLGQLKIKPEECMAFGDQYNDIEMLELVGTSYAMADAAPGISYYSDYVTDSVEDVLSDLIAGL